MKLEKYLNSIVELNKTKSESFGFINKECIKYKIKDINLCVIFDEFIYIDLTKSLLDTLNIDYKIDRIVNSIYWVIIDKKFNDEIIKIINNKIEYIHNIKTYNEKINVDRKIYLTGEDIDMFNERCFDEKHESIENTCDKSVDGA